jgi:hypothetical protein
MHLIPAVAKNASIGTVLSLKVGGMCILIHCRHCSLRMRSGSSRRFAIHPV